MAPGANPRRAALPALVAAMCGLLALLVVTGPAGAGTFSEEKLKGEQSRPYGLYLPTAWSAGASLPLVLVFHGGGGTYEGMRRMTDFDETAEKAGFIVAYPSGTAARAGRFRTWNAGTCCGKAHKDNVDDVAYVRAVVEDIAARYGADLERVYATGHSNGGMMSWMLACKAPDLVAAIAPNGGVADIDLSACAKGRAVPVMHFHGTADKCATYASGSCGGCFEEFMRARGIPAPERTSMCRGAQEGTSAWAAHLGCDETRAPMRTVGAARLEAYEGCPKGAEVMLWTIEGAGHTWPGGGSGLEACESEPEGKACREWSAIVGAKSSDISANDEMWAFFKAHSSAP